MNILYAFTDIHTKLLIMASTISGTVGDIFALVALCIVIVTELTCLLGYPVLARLVHQKDICHKVYPHDAFKVGAVGTTFWGFTMIVIFCQHVRLFSDGTRTWITTL